MVLGHFGPWRSYLKMGLKNDFFDFCSGNSGPPREVWQKIYANSNGGPSRGSRVRRPGSHQSERTFGIGPSKVPNFVVVN